MPSEVPEPAPDDEFRDPELSDAVARLQEALQRHREQPLLDLRPTDHGHEPTIDIARRPLGRKGEQQ